VAAQAVGGVAGAVLANAMFGRPLVEASTHVRTGPALWLGEVTATIGLVLTIHGTRASNPRAVPFAVGAYVGAAYWFTSSTSFANPAVTLARALSDSFAGIAPASVPAFVAAQVVGGGAALLVSAAVFPSGRPEARIGAGE
jgi:glycerol uptake facilitator-like aquaporin